VLPSNANGHYFGQPFWEPILAELERRSVPVFTHPADCPCIEVLGLGRASSVIEYPFDTARNITNGIYSGAFQRYSGLKLILAHGGGALPTLACRIGDLAELRGPTDTEVGPDDVRHILRDLYYDIALAASPNSLLPTLAVTSPGHILFGTDFPAAPPEAIDNNIANFMSFEFDECERIGVERGNATALFPASNGRRPVTTQLCHERVYVAVLEATALRSSVGVKRCSR
jgi:predicted TIM-barrel fold metal-dependent hydrolase